MAQSQGSVAQFFCSPVRSDPEFFIAMPQFVALLEQVLSGATTDASFLDYGLGAAHPSSALGLQDLQDICRIFGVNDAAFARLVQVTPQSVSEWRCQGVPRMLLARVERLAELARIFEREFKPSRIPGIVTTPDAWLEGGTILSTIENEGVDPVYSYLQRLFSYGSA